MARSKAFQHVLRAARIARYCDKNRLSTEQGIARLANIAEKRHASNRTRREVLAGLGAAAAGLMPWRTASAKPAPNVDIAIVGGGIPLATGDALSFKYLKKPNVAACFFGDGAINEGIFHETVNMAAIWDLPVVFFCETNK